MKYILLFGGTMENVDQLEGKARDDAMATYAASTERSEEYTKAGKVVGGEELQGPSTATTVTRKNGKISITDGPFIEAKEVIGGFAIVDVKDLDEALELAKAWPGGPVEVRPIVDHSADIAAAQDHSH